MKWDIIFDSDTVDGRNPAPVDMVNILLFTRFHTSRVVQDFHQQYGHFIEHQHSFFSRLKALIVG